MKSFLTKILLNKNIILLFLIILLAAFLRFWQLGKNPPGLYDDEVSLGYNAYSILKTGRDEYGNFLPFIFRSLNTYNPAFAVYTLVPSIAIFGLNEFGVRFPSAFLGTLTVILTYLLVRKLFRKVSTALVASLLLAISPWHLHFSRFYHEANIMIFFTLLGLLLFLYADSQRRFLYFSAASFGIAFNTSHGAKLWVSLFVLLILVVFKNKVLKFKKQLLLPVVILIIFVMPQIINVRDSLIRPSSVGIFNKANVFDTFIRGYLDHFSLNFLFTRGDYIGRHSVPGMGQVYIFELPLILVGLWRLLRIKDQTSRFLLAWFVISPIPASLAIPTPHAGRALTFLPLLSIFAAYGWETLRSVEVKTIYKLSSFVLLFIVAIYNISTYFHLYWKHYPKEKALDWSDGHKSMVQYIDKFYDQYDSIAITRNLGYSYIHLLFYMKYDPARYQIQSEDKNHFDKFEFFIGRLQQIKGKTLVINTPQPNDQNVLAEFKMNNGDTIFTAQERK